MRNPLPRSATISPGAQASLSGGGRGAGDSAKPHKSWKKNLTALPDLWPGPRALKCGEECLILWTNIYENDKLLLDCIKNFYNSKRRAMAIYRL